MTLVKNILSEHFVDKTTEKRIIVLMNKDMTEGCATESNFSVQKVISEESIYSKEHYLGSSSISTLFEIQKAKHAYIYSSDSSIYKAQTFIDFKELKSAEGINEQSIYILPIGFEDDYSLVIEKYGIDKILEWFDHEDPFLNVFNEIHKFLGNDPKNFIY